MKVESSPSGQPVNEPSPPTSRMSSAIACGQTLACTKPGDIRLEHQLRLERVLAQIEQLHRLGRRQHDARRDLGHVVRGVGRVQVVPVADLLRVGGIADVDDDPLRSVDVAAVEHAGDGVLARARERAGDLRRRLVADVEDDDVGVDRGDQDLAVGVRVLVRGALLGRAGVLVEHRADLDRVLGLLGVEDLQVAAGRDVEVVVDQSCAGRRAGLRCS